VAGRIVGFSEKEGVVGLSKLRSELKAAEPGMEKEVTAGLKVMADRIAGKARDDIRSPNTLRHGPSGLHDIANSIMGKASGANASVVAGGVRAPTFFGEEFGGRAGLSATHTFTGRKRSAAGIASFNRTRTHQFPPYLGKQGHFLYPTVRREADNVVDQFGELLDTLFPPQ
jgi:hypothetical protein